MAGIRCLRLEAGCRKTDVWRPSGNMEMFIEWKYIVNFDS